MRAKAPSRGCRSRQTSALPGDGFRTQRRAVLRALLEPAVERGEVAAGADLDLLVEVVYGTLWYRLLAASGPLDARFADALTELLLDRLRGEQAATISTGQCAERNAT